MSTVKLRYPVKLGEALHPAGTEVSRATLAEMRQVFPAIEDNAASNYIGVWFPQMEHPTVVLRKQLTVED